MGRSIPRLGERCWNCKMAASERGLGPCQHHMHSRLTRMRVSHNGLQFAGRQNPGRSARSTRYMPITPFFNRIPSIFTFPFVINASSLLLTQQLLIVIFCGRWTFYGKLCTVKFADIFVSPVFQSFYTDQRLPTFLNSLIYYWLKKSVYQYSECITKNAASHKCSKVRSHDN